MGLDIEGVVDGRMDGEETLSGALGFEPLLLSFPPSDGQVAVFGSIVLAQAAGVVTPGNSDFLHRRTIG